MTTVLCWRSGAEDYDAPWLVADSRVTKTSQNEQFPQTLTDLGVKLGTFPLVVRDQWTYGKPTYQGNVGLAFAGNALVGQNTLLMLTGICSHLVPKKDALERLSILHIAHLAARIATLCTRDVGSLLPNVACTEFALVGWCPDQAQWRIFHLSPSLVEDAPLTLKVREIEAASRDEVLILGTDKEVIELAIQSYRKQHPLHTLSWYRAPLQALAGTIRTNGCMKPVGGYIQLAIASESTKKVEINAVSEVDENFNILRDYFLGLDPNCDIGPVGPCIVATPSMTIDVSLSNDRLG